MLFYFLTTYSFILQYLNSGYLTIEGNKLTLTRRLTDASNFCFDRRSLADDFLIHSSDFYIENDDDKLVVSRYSGQKNQYFNLKLDLKGRLTINQFDKEAVYENDNKRFHFKNIKRQHNAGFILKGDINLENVPIQYKFANIIDMTVKEKQPEQEKGYKTHKYRLYEEAFKKRPTMWKRFKRLIND